MNQKLSASYKRSSLVILYTLLSVWALVSFGCGVLFRDWLDAYAPRIGNAPLGFWMAQQGAIICFVLILVIYAILMNRLDVRHGYKEEDDQ
jgi:putative solute:sodium symporter small subunit